MLLIISHHYVVNSGITAHYDYSNVSAKMIFLQFWGLWGKTAINAFVMITGYFMCTSSFKWIKYAKLYSQVLFYNIVIFFIMLFAGYEKYSQLNMDNLFFKFVQSEL